MKQDADFYRQRIADADRDVDAATLDNVRVRALRARSRWVELAEQDARATIEREKHRSDKAERDALRADAAAELAELEELADCDEVSELA